MFTHLCGSAVLGLLLFGFASAASAQDVSFSAFASMVLPTQSDVDSAGPASEGSLFVNAFIVDLPSCDGGGDAGSVAAINAAGASAVQLTGRFPTQSASTMEGRTDWTTTVVNETGEDQAYVLMFTIAPAHLKIYDPVGHSTGEKPSSRLDRIQNHLPESNYNIQLKLDDQTIFSSEASLIGGTEGHILEEFGTDLGGDFSMPDAQTLRYDFSQHSEEIALGTYPPGQGFTFQYLMTMCTSSPGSNVGNEAGVGDPLDLDSTPGVAIHIMVSPPLGTAQEAWGTVKQRYR